MAVLSCKTRGNTSPDRKQKVYFCAHPQDYFLLDTIANDLLKHQNCAVWYDPDPTGSYNADELSAHLAEMQLFVMPITTALLTQPSRAMSFDLSVARKLHIPVLPLMQESDLDGLFRQSFGNIQYLDRNNNDPTAIDYDEKLKKYLNSVLMNDEESARIRKAFAAYIFLSYRKKDRAYAQELMRLIHSADFCRDVAIWYDEFLTPSENFSENIISALEASDLFVLTVTPNVLENGNYVMVTEYPLAQERNKSCLPVELVKTSHLQLQSKYKGLPCCVDSHNTAALHDALKVHFGMLADNPDNSPAHLYDIGLAYLNGVDVEKNNDLALRLITSAAEKNHIDAITKLVQLYTYGIGVLPDYLSAIQWQEHLVTLAGKLYCECFNDPVDRTTKTQARARYIGEALTLSGMYCQNRMYDQAEHLIKKCQDALFLTTKANELTALDIMHIASFDTSLGDMYSLQMQHDLALKHFESSLRWWASVLPHRDTDGILVPETIINSPEQRILATYYHYILLCYSLIGSAKLELDDYSGAVTAFCAALKVFEGIRCDAFPNAGTWNTVLDGVHRAYMGLGRAYAHMGREAAADEAFLSGLRLGEAIYSETQKTRSLRALYVDYNQYGDFLLSISKVEAAREYFEKSLTLIRGITFGSSLQNSRDLAISLEKLASTYTGNPDSLDRALALYNEALDLRKKIKDTKGLEELISAYYELICVYLEKRDYENAIRLMSDAAAHCHSVPPETISPATLRTMASICSTLGIAYDKQLNDKDNARHCYKAAVSYSEGAVKITKSEQDYASLAFSYMTLATLPSSDPQEMGKILPDSLKLMEGALMIFAMLQKEHPDNEEYAQRLASVRSAYQLYKFLSGSFS